MNTTAFPLPCMRFSSRRRKSCSTLDGGAVEYEHTPWQQLWVEWIGLQAFSMHLADYTDHVARTIELLIRRERQQFEIAYRSPAPFINIPDNITVPAIGPKRFREYCVPLYNELGGMLEERGARLFIHMDGLLKPLWKDIAASKVGGLDSFTPVPDCDTSVAEALAQWPDKCCISTSRHQFTCNHRSKCAPCQTRYWQPLGIPGGFRSKSRKTCRWIFGAPHFPSSPTPLKTLAHPSHEES